jgi:lysylphosphatidylglycerol synthetase-like protein (DUF2156 family)
LHCLRTGLVSPFTTTMPKDYCCCAIPLVNAGIYLTIFIQFVVAFVAGILSVSTPSIVGAATPSFAPWILAIICFVGAAIQILGAIGVKREKAILFRRYVSLHSLAVVAAFAIAVVWIIISATRHTTAENNCLQKFFPDETDTSGEGQTMCNIFPWVSIGIMGALWAVLAIFFVYLWVVLSAYGRDQRTDHEKYEQLRDPVNGVQRDPWDSRMSTEEAKYQPDNGYGHIRQESAASVAEVISEPHQDPYDTTRYNYNYRY